MSAHPFTLLTGLWSLVAGVLVLLLPGLAWQAWFPAADRSLGRRLVDALGLSLAINALLGLAASLAGWRLSAGAVITLTGLMGLLAVSAMWRRRATGPAAANGPAAETGRVEPLDGDTQPASAGRGLMVSLLSTAFVLILAWRLYQARDLVLPAWVDSLHHVLIVRLMLETGGLPESFSPYMPVPFYYHYAFHAVTALFAFWARLEPVVATLLMGQVLNAAVSLAVYRLGLAVWEDWRPAGLAALLVGFITQMPAYYVTWGRYTLLAGLILLALAMAAAVEVARHGSSRARLARLAILTGGLLLTHYFAALLLALFLGVQAALLLAERASVWGQRSRRAVALLVSALAGLAMAAPWLGRVWRFASAYTRVRTILPDQSLDQAYFADYLPYLWYLLGPNRNVVLLLLGALGLVAVGWRKQARPLTLWTAGLLLIAFPWGPHLSPFRPDHAVIVLFLPATLYLGAGAWLAWETLSAGRLAGVGRTVLIAALASLLAWGLHDTRQIVNPVTVLAHAGDLRAVRWVAENTPPEARFYINVTLWQNGLYRGVDGGWWILPLTGRATLVPPSMYQLGERAYVEGVNALAARATGQQGCTDELMGLLRDGAFDYLYLGNEAGNLKPAALMDCEFLQPVYQQEGVSVFQVRH